MPSDLSSLIFYAAGAIFFLLIGAFLVVVYLYLKRRWSDKEEGGRDALLVEYPAQREEPVPIGRYDQKTPSSDREFQSLVESMPVGVFRMNLANEISYANEKFFEIFGIPFEEERVPADWISFILEEDRDRVLSAIDETKLKFRETKAIARIRTIGGATRQISFIFSAAISDTAVHFVGVANDLDDGALPAGEGERSEEEKAPVSTKMSQESESRTTGRVLLAEDSAVNQKIVRRMIESLGLSCDVADNGIDAVEMWKRGAYELVLLDCQMPHMDGIEAARLIRRMEDGLRRTPIVALTAQSLGDDRERCLAVGIDDCIPKPVTMERLRLVIEKTGIGQAAKGQGEMTEGADGSPVLDLETLRRSSGHDRHLEKERLDLFVTDTHRRLERIASLIAGQPDLFSVCREADAIKGASGVVGAVALKNAAYRLEKAAAEGDVTDIRALYDTLRYEFDRVNDVVARYRRTVLSETGA